MKTTDHKKRNFKDIKDMLSQVKNLLEELYQDRFLEMILFGSFAKKNATDHSDIDLALVLSDTVDRIKEIDAITDAVYGIMLEHNEVFSFLPVSKDEIENSDLPIYYNIRKEGIKI
jgi:predicted nucleotidyltransferase